MDHDIIIIGGGIAGLVSANLLAKKGFDVLLIEKKEYPYHKVCGEYISLEVLPFMKRSGMDITELNHNIITKLNVSSPSGKLISLKLDLGGIGISRYQLDYFLYQKAKSAGAVIKLNTTVTDVTFQEHFFQVVLSDGSILKSPLVLGSYGKRSGLDRITERESFLKKSPYVAVKYHILTDFPDDLIALHNFLNGYCGISKVDNEKYCLCYLTTREMLRKYGTIDEMEKGLLSANKHLKYIFNNSERLYKEPLVINEISFAKKELVHRHLMMTGDAAGMIAPLCGNGMAIAIHSAKILSETIPQFYNKQSIDRAALERAYVSHWNDAFSKRLWIGRNIQKMFGGENLTNISISLLNTFKPVASWLISKTHGKEF